MKKMHAVMRTSSTSEWDNHVPFVMLTMDVDKFIERISGVTRAISEMSAASVSFWSDDVATVDWFESFDLSRLDESNRLLLEETGIAYTTRDLWNDDAAHVFARVCVNMITFWDTSFSVQCEDKHIDVSYEGQLLLYRDVVPLLKEVQ